MKTFPLLFCLLALLECGSPCAAQIQGEDAVRLRTRVVLIDALVRNKRTGLPVRDLSRENFEVLDDGKPRQITYFSQTPGAVRRPLALVLVLDLRPGGAGRYLRKPEIVKSLADGLSKLPPEDEVAVMATWVGGYGLRQETLTGFTRDRARISSSLARVPGLVGAEPLTFGESLEYVVPEVTRLAISERPGSHVVVVYVSDGFNGMENSQRDRYVTSLLQANVTFSSLICKKLKVVSAGVISLTPLFALTGASLNVADHLARQTGGEVVRVRKPEDYGKGLEKIVGHLSARYTLGFELDDRQPDDGKLHRLEVRVKALDKQGKQQKLEVLARRGYYLPAAREQVKGGEGVPEQDKPAGAVMKIDRAKDEQAIRQAIYDLSLAEAKGDIETFKRLTSKRTLGLYRLWFGMLFNKLPPDAEARTVGSGDELFSLVLGLIAETAGGGAPLEETEKKARAEAESQITFISDREARIESRAGVASLAVFEDGQWKIDQTESLKQEILKMEELTPEERDRIKMY